jgi:hypothetical protein
LPTDADEFTPDGAHGVTRHFDFVFVGFFTVFWQCVVFLSLGFASILFVGMLRGSLGFWKQVQYKFPRRNFPAFAHLPHTACQRFVDENVPFARGQLAKFNLAFIANCLCWTL